MERSANLDFDIRKNDWEMFCDRLEQYFIANKITNAEEKRAILLSKVNAETYEEIAKICKPVKPKDKTYEEIITKVKDYLKPPASYLVYRYEFRLRKQSDGEGIKEYVTALKVMTDKCKFTNEDEQVLDQMICGLRSKAITAELLKLEKPDLETALKKAMASEAASKGAEKLQETNTEIQEVHMLSRGKFWRKQHEGDHRQGQRTWTRRGRTFGRARGTARAQQIPGGSACYRCGDSRHFVKDCMYRENVVYHTCGDKGHTARVCTHRAGKKDAEQKPRVGYVSECGSSSSSDGEMSRELSHMYIDNKRSLYSLYVPGKTRVEPQYVTVEINKSKIKMEIDSGAEPAIIPKEIIKKCFPKETMYEPDIEFRNHDNTVNKPAGMFKGVTVSLNNKIIKADLYVTESSGPPIIGRAWLKALGLWPLFKDLDLHIVKNKIDGNDRLNKILEKHAKFFENSKGSFNRAKIRLELKEDAKPIYELARSVPFALKDKIEKELDRLVEEKILEPVEMSEWATPIVPILKPNGDVRLCGAFNVTINPLLKTIRYAPPNFDHAMARLITKNINNKNKKRYSKIDLKEAFLQVPVEENSQNLLTINTHKGLFKCLYMMYGISSGPGYFQKQMEEVLKNINGVAVVADDVVVTGSDDEEHLRNLNIVLTSLEECGLKGRVNKCEFFKDEVNYLGYKLRDDTITVNEEKYRAIVDMKEPENHKELQLLLAVARETAKNETLSIVKRMVIEGWPDCSLKSWPNELQPYALRKDEIHVEKECLMWGQRVIVPPKLREKVIEKLHESHFGIVKMKSLARSVVWWPNIDKNLEDKSKYCKWCVESKDNPIRMELTPWPWPSQPWQRLHADFAGPYLGQTYLLVIDAYSKWPEIFIMKNISAEATIEKFREMFTTHGLPNHIVTDSGTQFTSDEYKKSLKQLGIKQDFSAPKHPATNGAAENLVKTFKRKLKAIVQSSKADIQKCTSGDACRGALQAKHAPGR
ncbi:uncharacterized protein K02A2.6-like [Neodiprion virginianus]|uniref:uncharacterized protein K02A2.6-like n=1 Tax=Neodiprion virginianus TaxID=2961670 RepID=UPI001EE74099|nr:uncharacterized protein K02A2.6-like [Neodiprion virginianus]